MKNHCLLLKERTLCEWVVELGVRIAHLLGGDEQFKALGQAFYLREKYFNFLN
jgi:hypothetical protein